MPDTLQQELATAQLSKLRLEIAKLEDDAAKTSRMERVDVVIKLLPALTVFLTIFGFVFTVWQYRVQQKDKLNAAMAQSENDRKEREENALRDSEVAQRVFMKPLLEKQQTLYFEASEAAATIATAKDGRQKAEATDKFWKLYWGPLVMMETTDVSGAMKRFGECLNAHCDDDDLRNHSLQLSSALEASMLKTWNSKPEDFVDKQFIYR